MKPLPEEAYAVALAELTGCGHRRLTAMLVAGSPKEVWRAVGEGRLLRLAGVAEALGRHGVTLAARWRREAAATEPAQVWARVSRLGVGVWSLGGPGYPAALRDDPAPPPVLFWQGDASLLGQPAVAIVGTRRCTGYGVDVARQLGKDLSDVGVAVVSGLALGIDGAAHEGALAGARAAPIAVVGSGLDVVYPGRHRPLWRRVVDAGLMLSEAPLGAAPEAWRFPLRNRVIAGLASVVVVVESHESGGSLSTVRAASDRGITVMAVPGSVRSSASAGTNRLLAEGVAPVVEAADVLVALALEGVPVAATNERSGTREPAAHPSQPEPAGAVDCAVLAAVDWTPTATEEVLRRTNLGVGEASAALIRLEMGAFVRRQGSWWERSGPPTSGGGGR